LITGHPLLSLFPFPLFRLMPWPPGCPPNITALCALDSLDFCFLPFVPLPAPSLTLFPANTLVSFRQSWLGLTFNQSFPLPFVTTSPPTRFLFFPHNRNDFCDQNHLFSPRLFSFFFFPSGLPPQNVLPILISFITTTRRMLDLCPFFHRFFTLSDLSPPLCFLCPFFSLTFPPPFFLFPRFFPTLHRCPEAVRLSWLGSVFLFFSLIPSFFSVGAGRTQSFSSPWHEIKPTSLGSWQAPGWICTPRVFFFFSFLPVLCGRLAVLEFLVHIPSNCKPGSCVLTLFFLLTKFFFFFPTPCIGYPPTLPFFFFLPRAATDIFQFLTTPACLRVLLFDVLLLNAPLPHFPFPFPPLLFFVLVFFFLWANTGTKW